MIKNAEWLAISKDRTMIVLLIAAALALLAVVLTSVLRIHISDVQIPSRYSAYGTSNIYRSQWYFLYSLPLFALLVFTLNGFLSIKIYPHSRLLGVVLLNLTLVLMIICLLVSNSIFNLAPAV